MVNFEQYKYIIINIKLQTLQKKNDLINVPNDIMVIVYIEILHHL